MKIKILKCSKPTYWYNNEIGNTFDVEKGGDYFFRFDKNGCSTHGMRVSDCEILSGETVKLVKTCPDCEVPMTLCDNGNFICEDETCTQDE